MFEDCVYKTKLSKNVHLHTFLCKKTTLRYIFMHSYCVLNKKTLLGPFVVWYVSVICHNLHNCRIKLLLKFQGIMLYTDVAREFLAHSYSSTTKVGSKTTTQRILRH